MIANKILQKLQKPFSLKEETFISNIKEKWTAPENFSYESPARLLNQLLNKIIHTYDGALEKSTERLDKIEIVCRS